MKFSHSLKLNCVQEWNDQYICYTHLKRIIHQIERLEFEAMQERQHRTIARAESLRRGPDLELGHRPEGEAVRAPSRIWMSRAKEMTSKWKAKRCC